MKSQCPQIFETCQLKIPCYLEALQKIGANQGDSVFVSQAVFHNNPICQTAEITRKKPLYKTKDN